MSEQLAGPSAVFPSGNLLGISRRLHHGIQILT